MVQVDYFIDFASSFEMENWDSLKSCLNKGLQSWDTKFAKMQH